MLSAEQEILESLRVVQDPDLDESIVDLGWIKEVKQDQTGVSLVLDLGAPTLYREQFLEDQCRQRLTQLGFRDVSISIAPFESRVPAGKRSIAGVRHLVAVASGKGGVGKSTIAFELAMALASRGSRVGILDCDIYGPSLPAMSGLFEKVGVDDQRRLIPHQRFGLKMMSAGFLVERYQSVNWRGPMLHKLLQQFLFGTQWGELDFLVLDLPPGTGDIQLSLTQSVAFSGAVLITTPQEVALRDVVKGYEMFLFFWVTILGIIENMSFFYCPRCDKKHRPFGKEGAARLTKQFAVPLLGELPLHPSIPSPLGRGQPLGSRSGGKPLAAIFDQLAGGLLAQLSKTRPAWAVSGPGAMEV